MCDADETEQAACSVQEPWDPCDKSKATVYPWDSSVSEEADGETDSSQTFQIPKAYEVSS